MVASWNSFHMNPLLALVSSLALSVMLGLIPSAAAAEIRADFAADPQWEGYRNRLFPETLPAVRQDFGWRRTEGSGGEVGGWVQRSVTPATFAKAMPVRTLNDRLSASGSFYVTDAQGGSGLMFGWFHENSRGWRMPNSLVFRLDGNGGKYWVFYEYGTRGWLTGGGGCFEGDRYQTTPTKPFKADGTKHLWSLTYDPDAESGNGLMTFVLDGKAYKQPLAPGHKLDGAEFNRFGMVNQQLTGDGMRVFFSDLGARWRGDRFESGPGLGRRGKSCGISAARATALSRFRLDGFGPRRWKARRNRRDNLARCAARLLRREDGNADAGR
jgi:hypothetical protein